jgi:hypothetical protein
MGDSAIGTLISHEYATGRSRCVDLPWTHLKPRRSKLGKANQTLDVNCPQPRLWKVRWGR